MNIQLSERILCLIQSIPPPSTQSSKDVPAITNTNYECSAWHKIVGKLMTTLPKNSVQAKTHVRSSLKIQCVDINIFRIVQRYLTKTESTLHALLLPDERLLKVVIKVLSVDITEGEIKQELSTLGFETNSIRQFKNSTQKFLIHLITFPLNSTSKQIFYFTFLSYITVRVKFFHSSKPAQCFAC